MYQALADALADARRDPAVKVVMITGGAEMFARRGNDLGDFANNPPHGR